MLVGIDLGTTFSLISHVGPGGAPTLCPNQHDLKEFQTPSVVHVGERGALVGHLAENLLEEEPGLPLCRFAKLSMGREEGIFTDHQGFDYRPEAISALVLRKLKADAEAHTGEAVEGAVITIPAHFNEAQRQATVNAGRLADLPVLGLIEEPVAAATYFGHDTGTAERTLFVFDLGGGTLDATVLQASSEGLYVLATEGADNIGGKNFDDVIMDIVREQYQAQHRSPVPGDLATQQTLRRFATACKIELAQPSRGAVSRPIILGGRPMRVTFNRAQFDAAAEPWLEASRLVCEQALQAVGLGWSDIDELVLTGGSSQLPCVEALVKDLSRLPAQRIGHNQPHTSVAYGACILAEQRFGNQPTIAPPLRQTVTSNELGIRVFDHERGKAVFHPLVHKNVPVPVSARQSVYVREDGQEQVTLEVLQRKDAHAQPETLGRFSFGPLREARKNDPIEIELGFSEVGRVLVTARNPKTGDAIERELQEGEGDELRGQYRRVSELLIRG